MPKRRREDAIGYQPTDSDRAIAAYRREQSQPVAYAKLALCSGSPRTRRTEDLPAAAPVRAAEPAGPAWLFSRETTPSRPSVPVAPAAADAAQTSVARYAAALARARRLPAGTHSRVSLSSPGRRASIRSRCGRRNAHAGAHRVFARRPAWVRRRSVPRWAARCRLSAKRYCSPTRPRTAAAVLFPAQSELPAGNRTYLLAALGQHRPRPSILSLRRRQIPATRLRRSVSSKRSPTPAAARIACCLTLTASTGWVIRGMSRLSPTVLVPLAPDMNSVISLGAIEKFLHGINSPEGDALKVFYLLNQFDASLPLHLDVREVLRRQLGDRLLPFVIRRARP